MANSKVTNDNLNLVHPYANNIHAVHFTLDTAAEFELVAAVTDKMIAVFGYTIMNEDGANAGTYVFETGSDDLIWAVGLAVSSHEVKGLRRNPYFVTQPGEALNITPAGSTDTRGVVYVGTAEKFEIYNEL